MTSDATGLAVVIHGPPASASALAHALEREGITASYDPPMEERGLGSELGLLGSELGWLAIRMVLQPALDELVGEKVRNAVRKIKKAFPGVRVTDESGIDVDIEYAHLLLDMPPEGERPRFLHIRRAGGTPWGLVQVDQGTWWPVWYAPANKSVWAPTKRLAGVRALNPTPEELAGLLPPEMPRDVALTLAADLLKARGH